MQFFIKRPHAIDQFRKRAGYGDEIDNIRLESILRHGLQDQASDGTNFIASRKDGEFVLRISVPDKKPVYAVLAPAPDKAYDYYIATIITEEMYQAWSKDGRLGSVADQLEDGGRSLPVLKPTVWLRYRGSDGMENFDEYLIEDLDVAVQQLIKKGIRISAISAFRQVQFDIKVMLPGFTP